MTTPSRRFSAVVLTLAAAAGTHSGAIQRPEPLPTELAWIGLFNDELLGWLENENRLDELCTTERWTASWIKCRTEKLEPRAVVIPLRSAPDPGASRLGEIVLVAVPGKGLTALASPGRPARPFTPDLYDGDWGYGPYFHQTILGRRGRWCRVPVPSIGAAWINTEDWTDIGPAEWECHLKRTVRAEDILRTPRGDMFVLDVDNSVLRVRPEQKADMWCQSGEPPALEPWQEVRIPFEQLFDSRGHLQIAYKYTRGC